jgi:hypothetical protein
MHRGYQNRDPRIVIIFYETQVEDSGLLVLDERGGYIGFAGDKRDLSVPPLSFGVIECPRFSLRITAYRLSIHRP